MEKSKGHNTGSNSEKHSKELATILTLGRKLHNRYSIEGVIGSATDEILNTLAPDRILFHMRKKGNLVLTDPSPEDIKNGSDSAPAPTNLCLCRLAADRGESVFSSDLPTEPRCTCGQCTRSAYASLAALPLLARKKVIGVLTICSLSPRDFESRRLFLEAMAYQIAASMETVLSLQKAKARITQLESRNDRLTRKELSHTKAASQTDNDRTLLQVFFDSTPDPIMLLDGRMRVKMLNRSARKYFRIDPGLKFTDSTCHHLFWKRATPCSGCELAANLDRTRPLVFERKCIIKPDCTERVSLFPIRATGELVVHISDISREKQIERELQQADKMISLGVLVSGVAHEINNPNNWTIMNAPILSEIWKDILPILDAYAGENGEFNAGGLPYSEMRKAVPQLLEGIFDGAKRIMRIVEELKNYSRHDPDKGRTPLDINQSLKTAVSLVSKQIEKSTSAFSVSYGENLPPIFGDSQKIEQVVVNLLLNACQALQDKNRGISLRSFYDDHSDKVVISVRDEGLGIPENVISRIMDPFFTTKRHMGGTGLGLSVSTKIVQDLGGQLTVKSKPGKGATFTVQLPTEQQIEKAKILVADDDELVRDFVARSLRRTQRFSVLEAANGVEACIMLGMDPPDILILDINMPDMDGIEVCRQIQKTPSLMELKVIVITGDNKSEKARTMTEMGYGIILKKPLAAGDITNTVETLMRGEEVVPESDCTHPEASNP
jgi:C4-dicarboxylate-specific signal transduction histidine kinase